jgi:GT2 family glycosyltransferase
MNKSTPDISVIIPTHNRCSALKRALDALSIQTCHLEKLEVLVVADGCKDDTYEMLRSYKAPFNLQKIEQRHQGPAKARNRGADRAKGKLLIFLDDDIEPAPSLVEAHARAHRQRPGHVVIGYLPTVIKRQIDFFHMELRRWWEAMFDAMRRPGHRYRYSDLLTGNFSISAELFNKIGGFDSDFWCHEDWELGVRLMKAGAPFIHEPNAIGYHHESTDLERSLQRKYQEGKADVLMGRCHPDLRSALPLARFKEPFSLLNYILAILAFRLPAIGYTLAASLRIAIDLLERLRFRRKWRRLLGYLHAYYYWLAVAKELHTLRNLRNYIQVGFSCTKGIGNEIEIELSEGLKAAERRINGERPSSVRLRYGRCRVGRILPQPGAEPLRCIHLRYMLATEFAKSLLRALTLEGVFDGEFDSKRILAVCSEKKRKSLDSHVP